jgi:hypothetical protein
MAKEFHADSSNQRDKEKFRVAKEPLYSVSKYLLFFFFFLDVSSSALFF